MNKSHTSFRICSPSLEEYILLNEVMRLVLNIGNDELDDVYTYDIV